MKTTESAKNKNYYDKKTSELIWAYIEHFKGRDPNPLNGLTFAEILEKARPM